MSRPVPCLTPLTVAAVVGSRTESLEGDMSLTITPGRPSVVPPRLVAVPTPVSTLTGVVDEVPPVVGGQGVATSVPPTVVGPTRPDTSGSQNVGPVMTSPVTVRGLQAVVDGPLGPLAALTVTGSQGRSEDGPVTDTPTRWEVIAGRLESVTSTKT